METDLHIAKRLAELLPPLNEDEKWQLKENLIADGGAFDPICYWHDGKRNVIVDGMHRWPVVKANHLEYQTREMQFASYDEAELWILNHQLGRRNLLSPQAQRKLVGDLYNRLKRDQGRPEKRGQIVPFIENEPIKTAEKVAETVGLSARTVKRDGVFAERLDKLDESLRRQIQEGAKVTDSQLKKLVTVSAASQKAIARALRVGQAEDITTAAKVAGVTLSTKPAKTAEELLADMDANEGDPPEPVEASPEEKAKQHNSTIESFCRKVDSLAKECPDLFWLQDSDRRAFFLTKVKNGLESLRAGKVVACPACDGDGCAKCRQQGMAPKQLLRSQGVSV